MYDPVLGSGDPSASMKPLCFWGGLRHTTAERLVDQEQAACCVHSSKALPKVTSEMRSNISLGWDPELRAIPQFSTTHPRQRFSGLGLENIQSESFDGRTH